MSAVRFCSFVEDWYDRFRFKSGLVLGVMNPGMTHR